MGRLALPDSAGSTCYVDWDRENALHQEIQRKREVPKGEGRGDAHHAAPGPRTIGTECSAPNAG
eukprot:4032078-Pyramimonas_sp.AAC.1